MSAESFELVNYTGEARHHMLKVKEQARINDVVVVAHEGCKEAIKLRQKSASEEKSGK